MTNVVEIAVKARDETKAAFASADKGASSFSNSMKSLNKVAVGASLAVGAGLLKVGYDSIETSRHIEDLDAKSQAVFGGQLSTVQKWADANKKAFGTSSREVVGLAANMADLLKPMGFTSKQAAGMSTQMLDLAGALSKWSGGQRSAAEVSEIMSKAMLGERDELKSLGISISDADVKARLAAKGQEKLTGAALQQATAIATQEMILEKSTDAQKAWKNGGKEAAEAQGSLSSALAETHETIAVMLTPAIEKGTEQLAKFAGWASNNQSTVMALGGGLAALAATVLIVNAAVKVFAAIQAVAAAATWVFTTAQNAATAAALGTRIGLAALAVQTAVVSAATKAYAAVQWVLNAAFWGSPITWIVAGIVGLVAVIILIERKTGFFSKTWQKVWGAVKAVFSATWGFIKSHWQTIFAILTGPIGLAVKWIINHWDGILSFFKSLPGRIAGMISGLVGILTWPHRTAFKIAVSVWTGAISFFKKLPGRIKSALGRLGALLIQAGRDIIQGLWNGITDKVSGLLDYIGGVAESIKSRFGSVMEMFSPSRVFHRFGVNMMKGLQNGLTVEMGKLPALLDKVLAIADKWHEKLRDTMSQRNDWASSFAEGFQSTFFGNDEVTSLADIFKVQSDEKKKAERLRRQVRKLTKMGLSEDLLNQLKESGESGLRQIALLASQAGQKDIQRLNALNYGTNQALGQAGMTGANSIYGSKIDYLKGQERQARLTAQWLAKVLREQKRRKTEPDTVIEIRSGGAKIDELLLEILRRSIRTRGGNVQTVLGKAG